jgi:predicted DCC family thiol-disulfide oxidoreductase YuxK
MTDITHILLYDGVCNLCSRLVRFISKRFRNGVILYYPLQSTEGKSLLKTYGLPEDDFDTVVYIRAGKYFLKSSAILHIVKELGGIWKGLSIFILIPVFIRDFIYTIIAKSRYRIFGRRDSCEY